MSKIDEGDVTKTLNEEDWEKIAGWILEKEKTLISSNYPEPKCVMIRWRDNIYIGSIQEMVPEFSHEIVLLSKSSQPLQTSLVEAIGKLDNQRPELYADESLDLDGRQHVVRLLEKRLVYMTHEQTEYMIKNMPNVCEI